MHFYNVTLVRDVEQFKKGEKFEMAQIGYVNSTLSLIRSGEEYKFKLKLDVE